MAPKLPSTRVSPSMPDVFQGEIYRQVGKYARGAVLYAFEQVGGPQGLADWAEQNPDEFYTKLFPKIIARESEVQHVRGVDDLMDLLDGDYEVMGESVEDAEVLEVDTAMEFGAPAYHEDREVRYVEPYFPDDPDWDIDDMVEFPDE